MYHYKYFISSHCLYNLLHETFISSLEFSVYGLIHSVPRLQSVRLLPLSLMHTVKFILLFFFPGSAVFSGSSAPCMHNQSHASPAPLTGNAFLLFPASSISAHITVTCPGGGKKQQITEALALCCVCTSV